MTKLRVAIAVVCLLYAAVAGGLAAALPWVVAVVALDLLATMVRTGRPVPHRHAEGWSLAAVMTAAAISGVAFVTGGAASAPLALIPAHHGAIRHGRTGFVAAYAFAALGAVVGRATLSGRPGPTTVEIVTWLASIAVIGALGFGSSRVPELGERREPAAVEAISLIERLDDLAASIGTGFDTNARASATLDTLARAVLSDRSALLLGTDPSHLQPVALRGATRVPWSREGAEVDRPVPPLEAAWSANGAALLAAADGLGERCVLAVPLVSVRGERCGIFLADREAANAFRAEEVEAVTRELRNAQPALDAAMLFASLRDRASFEERRRLARDMHDGIAQELSALGFLVDVIRMTAQAQDSPLVPDLVQLRATLEETLAQVNGQIADLRLPESHDGGLGAVVTSAVQTFRASTGVRTRVSVDERGDRLPSHLELLAYRTVMAVLADARRGGADAVAVDLVVRAPRVHLVAEHTGRCGLDDSAVGAEQWALQGGRVSIERCRVEAQVEDGHSPESRSTRAIAPHG